MHLRTILAISESGKVKTLQDVEDEAILLALYHAKGNKSHAADSLGICVRTMRNRTNRIKKKNKWLVPCQCWFNNYECQFHQK